MEAGLEVYTPEGQLTFSSEWGGARVLGRFVVETRTGSKEIFTSDGSPAYDVFAYIFPFTEFVRDLTYWGQAVWTEGNVIHWAEVSVGSTIVYGDGYQ